MNIIRFMFLIAVVFCPPIRAQFVDRLVNPQVNVTLTHPPDLGIKVDRVVLGKSTGRCSAPLSDALIQGFLNHQVEVVDQDSLSALLDRHNYRFGQTMSKKNIRDLNEILGSAAMIFVNVSRCGNERNHLVERRKTNEGAVIPVYISQTDGAMRVSLRVVDLNTARIFTAKTVDTRHRLRNESYEGYPEFPSNYDLQDYLIHQAVERINRMFFPWQEERLLYFFNDKKCGLKQAYRLLKSGDLQGAARLSKTNLDDCGNTQGVKPKILAHANYNLGMAYFFFNEYDEALRYFQEAYRIRPGGIITETMEECRKAIELEAQMREVEETASLFSEPLDPEPGAVEPETEQPSESSETALSIEERLKKLKDLFEKGLINEEEYKKKKAEILKDF